MGQTMKGEGLLQGGKTEEEKKRETLYAVGFSILAVFLIVLGVVIYLYISSTAAVDEQVECGSLTCTDSSGVEQVCTACTKSDFDPDTVPPSDSYYMFNLRLVNGNKNFTSADTYVYQPITYYDYTTKTTKTAYLKAKLVWTNATGTTVPEVLVARVLWVSTQSSSTTNCSASTLTCDSAQSSTCKDSSCNQYQVSYTARTGSNTSGDTYGYYQATFFMAGVPEGVVDDTVLSIGPITGPSGAQWTLESTEDIWEQNPAPVYVAGFYADYAGIQYDTYATTVTASSWCLLPPSDLLPGIPGVKFSGYGDTSTVTYTSAITTKKANTLPSSTSAGEGEGLTLLVPGGVDFEWTVNWLYTTDSGIKNLVYTFTQEGASANQTLGTSASAGNRVLYLGYYTGVSAGTGTTWDFSGATWNQNATTEDGRTYTYTLAYDQGVADQQGGSSSTIYVFRFYFPTAEML